MSEQDEAKHVLLRVIEECSGCHTPYEPEDVEVISRNGDMWFFSVTCSHCQARALVAAAISEDWDRDVAGPTALGAHGVPAPVTQRDVEEVRAFLEGFDGDFKRLFGS